MVKPAASAPEVSEVQSKTALTLLKCVTLAAGAVGK